MKSILCGPLSVHLFLTFFFFLLHNFCFSSSTSMIAGNNTDHLALLTFKAALTSDPLQTTASWNESTHFCNWIGITCGRRHQRVIAVNLMSISLSGPLSCAVGNLSFLRDLRLYNNSFTGKIPSEIGSLSRLRILGLGNNSFSGEIPKNISRCLNLVELQLEGNNLVGKIPVEFQSLLNLQHIVMRRNHLTGRIPAFFGNFSALQKISALDNNFQGSIPDTLGRLTNLTFLAFGINNLSGTIPPSFLNLSSLITIDLPENQIGGDLPSDIGLRFPRLRWFNIAQNNFTGSIPVSLSNASQLVMLSINLNDFTGKVPNFGGMQNLERLLLQYNQLGNGKADDLNFLSSLINCTKLVALHLGNNSLGGVLPKSLGNFSKLSKFTIDENLISGNIPTEIGKLQNLERALLGLNQFHGSIPDSIGNLKKLNVLSLYANELSGPIPSSLGNLTTLIELNLGKNNLQGSIPSSLEKCQNLLSLNLSRNNLSGHIPREVLGLSSLALGLDLSYNRLLGPLLLGPADSRNLGALDISHNMISGEIPTSLGSCTSLREFYIAGNSFQGTIPQSLSFLKGIEILDFSLNNLTGKIPQYFEKFSFLRNLNLSFNDFEGEVPLGGVFRNATALSVVGNSKLCGGVPELHLLKCTNKEALKEHGISHGLKLVVLISCGILVVILVLFSVFVYKQKHKNSVPRNDSRRDILFRVSYESIYAATDGFSSANLVGSGKFSSVYKAIVDQNETVVAVKVLNLKVRGASKSFVVECEALRHVRHRNLVKVVTSCSSIDFQGNDFKAIVYAYMANGNLDNWLHQNPGVGSGNENRKSLNLQQRLNIAIDVACALDYLHNHSGRPLVHCDLKPSNVLLDNDLVAHVGDFGLAEFFAETTPIFSSNHDSSIGIKGTIGYAAPEYGMGYEVSTYGDVYSYGILLLELFTGKRPTDEMYNNGLNLHEFAKMAIPEQVMEISDPALSLNEQDEITTKNFQVDHNMKRCLISVFRIGIACSMELPRERMNIKDVTAELHLIKDTFLVTRIHKKEGA